MSWPELVPQNFRPGAENAARVLARLDNVLIAAHVNPDGDAVGSMSAAGFLLKRLSRQFALYSPGAIPDYLGFLPLPGPVYRHLSDLPFTIKAALLLDTNEISRIGDELAANLGRWPCVNIDHHLGKQNLGTLAAFCEARAAATCQLLAYVAAALGERLDNELGAAIGLGLLTDTGNFAHGNTTAAVFALAAELELAGVRMSELAEQLRGGLSLARFRLWGRLFERIQLLKQGEIAFCAVSLADLAETGAKAEDLEGFVEELRRLKNVRIAALLREACATKCKFSLRSRGACDVQAIASRLAGGGHKNAAGGSIAGPLAQAEELLLDALSGACS